MPIDFSTSTDEDRAVLLGPEFRSLFVVSIRVERGHILTHVCLNGEVVMLIGDPQEALTNYLVGSHVEGGIPWETALQ